MSDVQLPGARASITAETSGFRAAIGSAQKSLVDLQPIIATQWWGLQNLARAFGAVGTAVAAGFGMAVSESIAWESAMTGVQRTTGAAGEEMERIEAGIRKVAMTTPIAVSELASLAEQAGALGIANSDIPEFIETMGNLIASTNLTVGSVDELARVMNVLQVPQESFDRFASTLLEVGRNTAATETEILNMAKRFAPAAQAAGLVAHEVLAITAAVLSLGPEAQAGATAIERTLFDMADAIGTQNEKLELFAQVAGKSIEDFSREFETRPAQAFAAFVTGIGTLRGGLTETSAIFEELGIIEIRQRRALIALAGGTQIAGDEQRNLNDILALAKEAWIENTALVDVAKARFGTAAAQMQIFRNQISEAANQVGVAFLPVLKIAIGVLQDLVFGFTSLHGPLKVVLLVFTAFIGLISLAVGSILGFLGPLVLAMQTLRALSGVLGKTGADAAAASIGNKALAASNVQVATTATMAAQQLSFLDSQMKIVNADAITGAGQMTLFGASVGRASASTAAAGTSVVATGSKLTKFAKLGGFIAIGLALATTALTLFGHKQRQTAQATEENAVANEELMRAIDSQARGLDRAADEWILNQIVMAGMDKVLDRLKISYAELVAIIKGTASVRFAKDFVADLQKAAEKGDKGAAALLKWTAQTNRTYRESASASGHLKDARSQLGITNNDTAETERNLATQTDKAREAQDKANQATIDLVGAILSQGAAALSVKEAQREYAKALADAADVAGATAEAEENLAAKRLDVEKAQREVTEAEKNLATAREQAAEELIDQEFRLADARDKYADSVDKVKDAEEALNKARTGPTIKEMTDATNKLAAAHNNLRKAEQAVEDAEWQIAYLRGEGASNRALEEAENTLLDARQSVADQTQSVADAEEELNKLRDGPTPEEMAKLERDLAGARRDAISSLRDIGKQEEALQDIRNDIANDTAYKEAQIELADAHQGVRDANRAVADAEQELNDIRNGSLTDEVTRAANNLERALYDQARANVEVKKQTALMRGEFWDAGREAQALANELGILFNQAPNNESLARLKEFVAILRQAKPQKAPSDGSGGGGGGGVGDADSGLSYDYGDIFPKPEDLPSSKKKWWENLLEPSNLLGALMFGQLLKRIFSATVVRQALAPLSGVISSGVRTALSVGLRAVVSALPGLARIVPYALVALLVVEIIRELGQTELGQKIAKRIAKFIGEVDWANTFNNLFSFDFSGFIDGFKEAGKNAVDGLWEGFIEWWNENEFLKDPGKWFGEHLVDPLKSWLGIHSPSTVFKEIGLDIVRGLYNGIVEKFRDVEQWFRELPGKILSFFGTVGGWIYREGSELIGGLLRGAFDRFREVAQWLRDLPGIIASTLGDLGHTLYKNGRDIVRGLWEGLESMKDWILERAKSLGNWVKDGVEKGIGWLLPGSPSKFGLAVGEGIGLGIAKGTKDILPMTRVAAASFAKNIEDVMMINPAVTAQFDDRAYRDLALRASEMGLVSARSSAASSSSVRQGDQFYITGADERSALDISEEVMFKKLVRTGG